MSRRLFAAPPATADVRPALMSVVSLMILLLPVLLLATSAQKLTGLALSVPGPTEQLPPEPPGPIETLRVQRASDGYTILAEVRRTDIGSGAGDTEQKQLSASDLRALQAQLRTLKGLDPDRDRIHLVPAADTPTEEVVRWMDAVRADAQGPLFPRVVLETAP